MAKKAAKKKTSRKAPVRSRAERLLDAVQGNKQANVTHRKGKPWEPTEIQWSWYILWTAHQNSIRQIAVMAKRSFETVRETIHKVQEWEWDALTEERVAIAKRQTRTLEHVFQDATDGWERSKQDAETVKTEEVTVDGLNFDNEATEIPATKTTKTVVGQAGDASFLNAQMNALKGIREIWGVDAPKESKVAIDTTEGAGMERVCGMTREEAIRREAAALLATATAIADRGVEG